MSLGTKIANVLVRKHDVNELRVIAIDPVWEEAGIALEIFYDEEGERNGNDV